VVSAPVTQTNLLSGSSSKAPAIPLTHCATHVNEEKGRTSFGLCARSYLVGNPEAKDFPPPWEHQFACAPMTKVPDKDHLYLSSAGGTALYRLNAPQT